MWILMSEKTRGIAILGSTGSIKPGSDVIRAKRLHAEVLIWKKL